MILLRLFTIVLCSVAIFDKEVCLFSPAKELEFQCNRDSRGVRVCFLALSRRMTSFHPALLYLAPP